MVKEQVRVLLRGNLQVLRTEWERSAPWPFGSLGVQTLASDSPEYRLLKRLLPAYPDVHCTEFVERSYSKKELLSFNGFILWVNHDIDTEAGMGLQYGKGCPSCGFAQERRRVSPINLNRASRPKRDLASTDDWEIVVSSRLREAWEAAGLTGATFAPVAVENTVGDFWQMVIERNLASQLEDTLYYEGERCSVCGRFDKSYPRHPSKELWIPREAWIDADIAYLNANLERSYHPRKLLSRQAYQLISDVKATGFWVQPIHLV